MSMEGFYLKAQIDSLREKSEKLEINLRLLEAKFYELLDIVEIQNSTIVELTQEIIELKAGMIKDKK